MLNRGKKHRKRRVATVQTRSASLSGVRRLGFEAMEGRLMLAGDAPDFLTWDGYSHEFRIAVYPISAAPLQTVPVDYVDGGFIQPGAVLTGTSAYPGTFDTVTNRANFGNINVFGPEPSTSGSVNLSASGDVDFDYSGVHLDTPAIPVVVFPDADNDLGTTFVDQPADVGPQPAEVTADEGGAIPINSILAFVGHTDSWKSRERIASKANSSVSDMDSAIPTLIPLAQTRDISGEWARPTMLEMAGSEPASVQLPEASQHDRTPLSDGEDSLRFRRALSSGAAADTPANDSQAARESDGSRRGSDKVPSEEATSASRRLSSAPQLPASLVLASQVADAHSLVRPGAAEPSESANAESGSTSELALNESAYAEVYDQLGSDAGGAEAVFNRDAWRDSWKATPLLMILALERIAASNSRRAQRETSCNAGRPHSSPRASADPPDPV